MTGPDARDDTTADYERLETDLLDQDRDTACVAMADVDETTARQLVNAPVDEDLVTAVVEQRVLVHEPSGEASDAIRQANNRERNRAGIPRGPLEKLEGFAEYAAENPAEVQLGLSARSTYEGTCAHSLAKVDGYTLGGETIAHETRKYTIPYGAWREVLDAGGWVGGTDRLEPIEAALSALASCINVGITINAVANGVDIEHLQTRVRTEFDPRVLFSLKDLGEASTAPSGDLYLMSG